MPFPPAQAKPSSRSAFACAMSDWARTDGLAWIHVFKTVSAALLALLIAMRLDLPQPRTAMTTVFIVMLPQSGMVIAKSFYRLCGTMVGLIVMLVLVALFSQQRVLFLSSTAVWVGICTAGAARNRHFKSYGFVLAGYTAALIGIPAAQQPDGAFLSAMTRAVEVTLGIACSGAVSALVFPQYAGEQIRTTIRELPGGRSRSFAKRIDERGVCGRYRWLRSSPKCCSARRAGSSHATRATRPAERRIHECLDTLPCIAAVDESLACE
jgi:hypothetical protein